MFDANGKMYDPFGEYMDRSPKITFFDTPVGAVSPAEFQRFADADGIFRKSFDATVQSELFDEAWVLSTLAMYESADGKIPAVQVRLIDADGKTLYYAPVYEIGSKVDYRRREWRIPPTIDRYDTVRISFIIPDGVQLILRDIRVKRNSRMRAEDIGVRYHGHAAFPGYGPGNSLFGFHMTAEIGYASVITIPKFTKDGVGVCFHDDDSVRRTMLRDDGSIINEGDPDDKPVCEFTYDEILKYDIGGKKNAIFRGMRIPTMEDFFRSCSMTGMQPIFSVHPALTREEWLYTRALLEKYRLLEHFWIKMNSPEATRIAVDVFGDDIAGYILIQGAVQDWSMAQRAAECGLDRVKHNVVAEFFLHTITKEKIQRARAEGFPVSIAAMKGGASGVYMQELIDLGVSEFTLDHHCSMGLDW